MDLRTNSKRSAICAGVKVVRLARHGSASSFRNAVYTAPSIRTFVNSDSTSKDTMISLSSTLSPLIVDTKCTELLTLYSDFSVEGDNTSAR